MSVQTSITSSQMRSILGRFCTGVTVVTTANDQGEIHGMTANAFISVSLDPPLVLVSVDRRAHMHELLPQTGRFGVSVLAAEQERLAVHFAGRPLREHGELFDRVAGVPFVRGAIAHVGCSLHDRHPAGDHTLYLGRVEHLADHPGQPLVFHQGAFGLLSNDEALAPTWGW
jgi:flavin reductase (DIM6/NTAB) family NADH-FMN oxidoreductase RutF